MNFFAKEKWPHRLTVPKKKVMIPKEEKSRCVDVNLNQLISPCPLLFLLGSRKFLLGNMSL